MSEINDDIAAIKAALDAYKHHDRYIAYGLAIDPDRIARLVAHVERLESCLNGIADDFDDCLFDICRAALEGKE